ncbi:hypothetical protein LFL96_21435 [Paraburkholderia sp. D15]|uniref:hypothetical protein n=1 Tax=Paraburkholderia sp. D15 TaxID=2880218 RepID=UPI00247A6492|nr:hypothetical protein [Paraburkholderia sp. D15]WGS54862.1 hypothetical protein LFL96_21435 [Paraburkholderia sp. D15]
MATNITITKRLRGGVDDGGEPVTRKARAKANTNANAASSASAGARRLPGWLWFIALWCFGVGSAMSLGFAFKLLMNATLFAVK